MSTFTRRLPAITTPSTRTRPKTSCSTAELAEELAARLIVGSGTGRVLLHLAQEGYDVHGIEIEPTMLDRARTKIAGMPHLRDRITMHVGDALKVPLEGKFKLAIIPYNTLMHFHQKRRTGGCSSGCASGSSADGALVIDLPNAGEAFAAPDTEAVTLERTFLELDSGHLVMQQSVSRLDRVEQLMQVTWIYDEIGEDGVLSRTVVPVLIRYYFYAELRLLLELCGFAVDEVYGDFDRIPFEDGVPRMIVVAR